MTKKKTVDSEQFAVVSEEQAPEEQEPAQALYEPAMWKNIKPVFRCATCGTYRDTEDDIILHVVTHLPADKQLDVFDKLMKKEQ